MADTVPAPAQAPAAAAAPAADPLTKVFMGNLPYATTWDEVYSAVSLVGSVANVELPMVNDETCKGYALIEMSTAEDAANLIDQLDKTEMGGRNIVVRMDRKAARAAAGPPDPASFEPDMDNLTNRLFVSNLSYQATWQDLKDLFGEVGPVAFADVLRRRDGRSKGCGIVEFVEQADAVTAVQTLQHAVHMGRELHIREDREDDAYGGDRRKRA